MAEPARRAPAPLDLEPLEDDPFRFGWRLRKVRLPGGRFEVRKVPLTVEDFLDPQLGDVMVQGGEHARIARWLTGLLEDRYELRGDVLVCFDMKMLWGIRGLQEPAPDVAVVWGIRDKTKNRDSFDVRKEGVRPRFVVEVVSPKDPELRRADYGDKVEIYQRAGVEELFLFDPPSRATGHRFKLTGYRLDPSGRYQPAESDAEGRLLSKTTGLWFQVSGDGQEVHVFDVETNERLLTAREAQKKAEAEVARQAEAREAAERRAQDAEEELARLRARLERFEKKTPPSGS